MSHLPLHRVTWAALAALTCALIGCGGSPTSVGDNGNAIAQGQNRSSATASVKPMPVSSNTSSNPTGTAGTSADDISKNPFIIWIKRNYPKTAAQIIDQYLSTQIMGTYDPSVEGQRQQLRTSVIDTVMGELTKALKPNLPPGLSVARSGNRAVIAGVTQQQGQNINITCAFEVYMDQAGIVWITQPADTVKATSSSWLVKLFGGNLAKQAIDQIVTSLNKEGPKSAAMTPGLTYLKGGTFRLDPGIAFINMPG